MANKTVVTTAPRRGTSPEGAEGAHAHGNTTPEASTDNINGSKKRGKLLLCMGNPSGSLGQLPYKAEQLILAGFATPSSCIDK